VPYVGSFVTRKQAAVKGSRRSERTLEGCVETAVIAEALSGLAEWAHRASQSDPSAGYSRDDEEGVLGGTSTTTLLGCTSEESGRPGSNRHDQLGRLRFYH
jgi:hypothetical protein